MLNHLLLLNASGHPTIISSMFVVTGSFVLLLVLIKHFAWEQITDIFKQREEKISNDLDSAEQSRIQANAYEVEMKKRLSTSQNEAQAIINNAKVVGESNRQTILSETEEEVERMKTKAQELLAYEREKALAEAKAEVVSLSLQVAEKILNNDLSMENQTALIDQYIEGLGTENESK